MQCSSEWAACSARHTMRPAVDSGAVGGWSDELRPRGRSGPLHADVCPRTWCSGVACGGPARLGLRRPGTAPLRRGPDRQDVRAAHRALDAARPPGVPRRVPRFGCWRAPTASSRGGRALVSAVDESRAVSRAFVARRVAAGEQAFVKMWRTYGGEERDRLDSEWLGAHRSDLERAVAG